MHFSTGLCNPTDRSLLPVLGIRTVFFSKELKH